MQRSLKAFVAVSVLSVSACASTGVEDELAVESTDEAIDGKADAAVDGAFTYFEVWADFRKCAAPMCGGFYLKRLNRSTTVCADGSAKSSCYAPSLDWSESHLSDTLQAQLIEAANRDAMSYGAIALVRGRIASKT
jgi:hypothetical protein